VLVGEAVDNSDPSCSNHTPNAQFWEEATRIAAEIEQSASKKTHMTDPSSTINAHTEDQDITEPTTPLRPVHDIECPTFNLLPEGETWTQHFAANNHPSPRDVANISTSIGRTSKNTSGMGRLLPCHPSHINYLSNHMYLMYSVFHSYFNRCCKH
jgi:hypothetical protein